MFCPITEKKHFSCELRMWCFTAAAWLTAMARVRSLARELPYDSGVAKKLKKKKKKKTISGWGTNCSGFIPNSLDVWIPTSYSWGEVFIPMNKPNTDMNKVISNEVLGVKPSCKHSQLFPCLCSFDF